MIQSLRWLAAAGLLLSIPVQAVESVALDYRVRFLPQSDQAEVVLDLARGEVVRQLDFNLGSDGAYSDFRASGDWKQEGERGIWQPAAGRATLSYRVKVSHPRVDGRFDARMTPDWAILRGDDLVPAARLRMETGYRLSSHLSFDLPKGWSADTGWPKVSGERYRIRNPARRLDRPTGWIIAGRIGVRRATFGKTDVAIAAPTGEGLRRMDILTLLTWTLPQFQQVFPRTPEKLLIVGAGDPRWRGGLSAPNSLFMHADRPLVSENGTSSLLHELVHVYSGIRDTERSDWISEGLAEYYAIELLRRAGGMTDERYLKVRASLQRWGRKVSSLRTEQSSGPVTARAVVLLQDLDEEIRTTSQGRRSLDDVARGLMRLEKVSTNDFVLISENVLGGRSKVLATRLLK